MNTFGELALDLRSLVIFRGLLKDKVVHRLLRLLEAIDSPTAECVNQYSALMAQLYPCGDNLTDYLLRRVLLDDNIYIRLVAQGRKPDAHLTRCVEQELCKIGRIARLAAADVCATLGYAGYLPQWQTSNIDFAALYLGAASTAATRGYGMFAEYAMFQRKGGVLVPVEHPDPIRLSDLCGYEHQHEEVVRNTLALIAGKPAANALLYGDAGTGKSSTVKAVVNEYSEQGLRLIELTKNQLHEIPDIIAGLSDNPLNFILFIDDLSFTSIGDEFNALKAVLEGSASARTQNFAIYATSNRRHLIKERFSDREGDDIHLNETMQEMASLSDRFGLSVGFYKPDKRQYLDIVLALKHRHDIVMEDNTLFLEAERFATLRGGRSPRAAMQFILQLKAR